MRNVGFTEEEINQIIDFIVAILNLGNVDFMETQKSGAGTCATISKET